MFIKMIQNLILTLFDLSRKMGKQNISAFASSSAYFIFLSLVPMLILICTIVPFTPLTEGNLIMVVTEFAPSIVRDLLVALVSNIYEKSAGILSIAAIGTVWSAGKGVLALMRGLNAINNVEEERNYFVVRFIATFYTIVLLIATIISLLIMVFGGKMVDLLILHFSRLQYVFSFIVNFRFLISWLVLMFLFCVVYTFLPDKKLKFVEQIPGAIFSAVVWSVFSWGFSVYVEHTNTYTIYGTLSLIMMVMVWLYFCMYIILIGAYLNRYFMPITKILIYRKRKK